MDSLHEKHPEVVIKSQLMGTAENMEMIADQTFDAVVGTHILCCIKNKEAAIREIHRVLRKVSYFSVNS